MIIKEQSKVAKIVKVIAKAKLRKFRDDYRKTCFDYANPYNTKAV
jgi:F0F1-type ATP synthase gamma subunit